MGVALIPRGPVRSDLLRRIARRVLHGDRGDESTETDCQVGGVTLMEHQVDAVRRLRPAIERHGGALLADDVGLGKTFVALAIASRYREVDIIAPAVLVPMWRGAVGTTRQSQARVRSLHRFSRGEVSPSDGERRLVIVDEAHHLRTPSTWRYGNVARFVIGADVLLLSATPVHNRPEDLAALLALFSGVRADQLNDARLAELVVRRRAGDPSLAGADAGVASPPAVVHHRHPIPNGDARILEALRGLPPPLPVAHGSAATALVRLALLRAWCSSDAALSSAIRRRRARGLAMRQALGRGMLPSRGELRTWAVGDDGVQLGLVELLVESRHESDANVQYTRTLDAHLQALAQVVELLDRSSLDDLRVAVVQSLTGSTDTPVVLFSQFASTARAYFRRLAPMGGVGLLTGTVAELASGRIPRAEALARFSPSLPGVETFATHARVRVLVATDLLAEGVNLQHAGSVVHLDLPWTDALVRQRVGRIARIGGPRAVVHAHTLEPPPDAAAAVRVLELLARKARDAERVVGGTARSGSSTGRVSRASAADAATRLRTVLRAWSQIDGEADDEGEPGDRCHGIVDAGHPIVLAVAPVLASRCSSPAGPHEDAGIALVRTADGVVLLALAVRGSARVAHGEWTATDELDAVLGVVERLDAVRDSVTPAFRTGDLTRWAGDAVVRWHAGRRARAAMGREPAGMSVWQRRALREIGASVAESTVLERARSGGLALAARAAVEAACGIGAEESLREWIGLRSSPLLLRDWLGAWERWPLLRRAMARAAWHPAPSGGAGRGVAAEAPVEIEALVLLVAGAGAGHDGTGG